jgi:hypothetical protein
MGNDQGSAGGLPEFDNSGIMLFENHANFAEKGNTKRCIRSHAFVKYTIPLCLGIILDGCTHVRV